MEVLPVLLLTLYMFPSILGVARSVKNRGSLVVINLLLGWTGLCWIITLAWACSDSVRKE